MPIALYLHLPYHLVCYHGVFYFFKKKILTCYWAKCCKPLVLERALLQDSEKAVNTNGSFSLWLDSSKPHFLKKMRRVAQESIDFLNKYCCLSSGFPNENKMLDCPWRIVSVNIWCPSVYTNVFL